jgi:hypothetical protein
MRRSIAGLRETYDLLDAQANRIPSRPLQERRDLLERRGEAEEERVAQELLLIELEAADTVVDPPSAESGQALADALVKLEEMRQTTDQVSRLLDLAAQAISSYSAHRQEVDGRAHSA